MLLIKFIPLRTKRKRFFRGSNNDRDNGGTVDEELQFVRKQTRLLTTFYKIGRWVYLQSVRNIKIQSIYIDTSSSNHLKYESTCSIKKIGQIAIGFLLGKALANLQIVKI